MTGIAPGAVARMISRSFFMCGREAGDNDAKYRRVCTAVLLGSTRIPNSTFQILDCAALRHPLVDGRSRRRELALLVVVLVRVVDAFAVGRQHVDDDLDHLAAALVRDLVGPIVDLLHGGRFPPPLPP